MKSLILSTVVTLCFLVSSFAYALSDKKYLEYKKNSSLFEYAEIILNSSWKRLKSLLKKDKYKELLKDQRSWLKKRDKLAAKLIAENGLSQVEAYSIVSLNRSQYLKNLINEEETIKVVEPAECAKIAEQNIALQTHVNQLENELQTCQGSSTHVHSASEPKAGTAGDMKLQQEQPEAQKKETKGNRRTVDHSPKQEKYPVQEILDAYTANEMAFDDQFKNRKITVVGKVTKIAKTTDGACEVVLKGMWKDPFDLLTCKLSSGATRKALKLTKGDTVTVEGAYQGKGSMQFEKLVLHECLFVSNTKKEPQKEASSALLKQEKYPVQEILDAYTANEMAFDDQFKNRKITVVGKVTKIAKTTDGACEVVLKGMWKDPFDLLTCKLSPGATRKALRLRKGDTATIEGVYQGKGSMQFKKLILHNCLLK